MLSPFRSLKGLAHEDVVMIRNQRSVIIDGIGVGIVGGIATFLAVFLARLGASPLLVGLLTSMPAFTGLLLAQTLASTRCWQYQCQQ